MKNLSLRQKCRRRGNSVQVGVMGDAQVVNLWTVVSFSRWENYKSLGIEDHLHSKTALYKLFEKNSFVFLVSSYLCIHYEVFFKKKKNTTTTDLHNRSHPEAAIFKTSLCSLWKVLVQRQKTENRQIF